VRRGAAFPGADYGNDVGPRLFFREKKGKEIALRLPFTGLVGEPNIEINLKPPHQKEGGGKAILCVPVLHEKKQKPASPSLLRGKKKEKKRQLLLIKLILKPCGEGRKRHCGRRRKKATASGQKTHSHRDSLFTIGLPLLQLKKRPGRNHMFFRLPKKKREDTLPSAGVYAIKQLVLSRGRKGKGRGGREFLDHIGAISLGAGRGAGRDRSMCIGQSQREKREKKKLGILLSFLTQGGSETLLSYVIARLEKEEKKKEGLMLAQFPAPARGDLKGSIRPCRDPPRNSPEERKKKEGGK